MGKLSGRAVALALVLRSMFCNHLLMGIKFGILVNKGHHLRQYILIGARNMATFETLKFDNLLLRSLPIDSNEDNYVRTVSGACMSRVPLEPLEKPTMVAYSLSAAELLDISKDQLERQEAAEYMSGSIHLPGAELASHCYCGHQFGYFAGQLGDGAVKYLGEVLNRKGERWEIQLKGAGPTPYSRDADGRKVLRSSIREFLCSEAMHHLGIPTTRAMTCVTSESQVVRDIYYDGHPIMEKCTVVSRIAPTFLRFGSYEIFKPLDPLTGRVGPSVGQSELLIKMLHYTISTFYKDIYSTFSENPSKMYGEFFREVVKKTAYLVAEWQCVGFCHGVLNTDNMSIVGLTIDYGPYGFMDNFNPQHICNLSDDGGRYSYNNQPRICAWNLNKFAEALKPVLPLEESQSILEATFSTEYNRCYLDKMRRKLGLIKKELTEDRDLITNFFNAMEVTGADFTNCFRVLSKASMPGCSDFEESIADVKEKLLNECCSVDELLLIFKPTMDDSHIKAFVSLLSQHPEIMEQLGKSAMAINQELERRKKFEEIKKLSPEEKRKKDEETWDAWLDEYKQRLYLETEGIDDVEHLNQDKVKIMNSTNPKFVLRNHIAQVAIEAAEKGDYSEVRKVLEILENPFNEELPDSPKEHSSTHSSKSGEIESDAESQRITRRYDAPPPQWARCLKVSCSS